MKKLYFLLLTILLIGNSGVHGQFQVVHDLGNTEMNPPQIKSVVTSDGGMITVQRIDTVHLFRKYDGQGQLLWNKVLEDTTGQYISTKTMIANDNGGCLFGRYAGSHAAPDVFDPDSLWTYFNILELDGNGAVIRSLQLEKFHHYMMYVGVHSIELASLQDGTVFLLVTYQESGISGFIELYKIQFDGTLAWARSIGNDYWNIYPDETNPTFAHTGNPEARMIVDQQGNIYITERTNLHLAKLASNGDLLWVNQHSYSNTSTNIYYEDLQINADGTIQAGGPLSNSVGDFTFFVNIGATGNIEKADIYRLPEVNLQSDNGSFGIDNDGNRYYQGHYYEVVGTTATEKQFVLKADTSGSPAQLLRRNDQVILPNNVFVPIHDMDVHEDRVSISALLNHENVDFAFTTRYETAILFDTGDLFSCIFTDSALAHIPVPLELFTTTVPDNAASIDISPYVDVYPMTSYTVTDAGTEPLEDLCTFAYNLLGIQIGIEEGTVEGSPLVNQTLIAAGSPLAIIHPEVIRIELYNASGQLLIEKIFTHTDRSIMETDHGTGIHFLRGFDRNGSQVAVQRIMIE